MTLVVTHAYPAVEDAVGLKLPKAVFALQADSILPSDFSDDGRMAIVQIYPVILESFFQLYDLKVHSVMAFGFLNWVLCGWAVFALSRLIGAGSTAAIVSVAFVLLTPILVLQGTSEGDDILAATPFIVACYFIVLWFKRDPRPVYAFVSGVALGLSIGLKSYPLICTLSLAVMSMSSLWREGPRRVLAWAKRRASSLLAWVAGVFVGLGPLMVFNQVAYGSISYVAPQTLSLRNVPFSITCGVRNVAAYLAQFLVADVTSYVRVLAPHLAQRWNTGLARMIPSDPGGCSAYGEKIVFAQTYLSENTVWFGLLGPILAGSLVWALWFRRKDAILVGLASVPIVWLLVLAGSEKYIAGIERYWTTALLPGVPVIAVAVTALGKQKRYASLIVILALIVTGCLASVTLLNNVYRPFSVVRGDEDRLTSHFSQQVRESIGHLRTLNVQTSYGVDVYDYDLMLPPKSTLYNRRQLSSDGANAVVVRGYGVFDNPFEDPRIPVPMKVPFGQGFHFMGPVPWGLSFIDNLPRPPIGTDTVDGRFLVFQLSGIKIGPTNVTGAVFGVLDPVIASRVSYRLGWQDSAGGRQIATTWSKAPSVNFSVPADAAMIVVEARFDGGSDEDAGSFAWPARDFDGSTIRRLMESEGARPVRADRRIVFDYQASGDEDAEMMTEGWSLSERTHRWSNAAQSDIDFRVPEDLASCRFQADVITAGPQSISVLLNQHPVAVLKLQSWFPGQDIHLDLPDADLLRGGNRLTLAYDHPLTAQGRDLALGVIKASVRCAEKGSAATVASGRRVP